MDLSQLRDRLSRVDRELLELVAERQRLSREIARVKRATGHPTRDFRRERDVILNARAAAESLGVPPDVAEQILRLLIRSSLATQERVQVEARGGGQGKRALVIGGRGKMGGWFVEFLTSQGWAVEIADPAGGLAGHAHVARWEDSALDHELIVVATPLGVTARVLTDLAQRRPSGLICELASLKTPLRAGLQALRDAGCRVAPLHPMFGPDTDLLSGRHVILIDLGDASALAAAEELFAATMANRVVMNLEEHDRLVAYVLGLSHALNIAFFSALESSGEVAARLTRISSTTFDAQLEVAKRVAGESPALYFEIQALNDYGSESLAALLLAVERLRAIVRSGDAAAFTALMERGRRYLDERPDADGSAAVAGASA